MFISAGGIELQRCVELQSGVVPQLYFIGLVLNKWQCTLNEKNYWSTNMFISTGGVELQQRVELQSGVAPHLYDF